MLSFDYLTFRFDLGPLACAPNDILHKIRPFLVFCPRKHFSVILNSVGAQSFVGNPKLHRAYRYTDQKWFYLKSTIIFASKDENMGFLFEVKVRTG